MALAGSVSEPLTTSVLTLRRSASARRLGRGREVAPAPAAQSAALDELDQGRPGNVGQRAVNSAVVGQGHRLTGGGHALEQAGEAGGRLEGGGRPWIHTGTHYRVPAVEALTSPVTELVWESMLSRPCSVSAPALESTRAAKSVPASELI